MTKMKKKKVSRKIKQWTFGNCKRRGYHKWCDHRGANVDSITESPYDMYVRFICDDCHAEATGTVEWEEEAEADARVRRHGRIASYLREVRE